MIYSIKGKVVDIIHDPGRTAPIALVKFENGEKRHILAPESIHIDDEIECGVSAPISFGNTLPRGAWLPFVCQRV